MVNYFSVTFFLFLIFGVFFNELIAFNPLDEIFEVVFFALGIIYLFASKSPLINRRAAICVCFFMFFLVYSIVIRSNSISGIALDFVLQAKPYIGFFVIYNSKQVLSPRAKSLISRLAVVFVLLALIVTLVGLAQGDLSAMLFFFFFHPSRFATVITVFAILFLFFSDYKVKDRIIYVLLLSVGLMSFKGKFFGFYAGSIFLLFYLRKQTIIKLSVKNVILGIVLAGVVIIAAREKILLYMSGFSLDADSPTVVLARPYLYMKSVDIFIDYFPFGSGFASYATHASGLYYSDIYYKYGLNNVWGLEKSAPIFVADTYYPSLAQFGVVGVIFFLLFWGSIIKEMQALQIKNYNSKIYLLFWLIVLFFSIELVADATLTNNRGMVMMMLLAYLLNEQRFQQLKY